MIAIRGRDAEAVIEQIIAKFALLSVHMQARGAGQAISVGMQERVQ